MDHSESSTPPCVILAGGFGTRLSEHTDRTPKPMVEIGGRPILWHIMMHYFGHGFDDFIIALGYRGEVIKRYMVEASQFAGDLAVDFGRGQVQRKSSSTPDWHVALVETGLRTKTGGRVKRLASYLRDGTFMLTWGDGVSDVDLNRLLAFHRAHGRLATVTVVRPPARFGHVEIEGDEVVEFSEKPQAGEGWINGAFFVLEPGVLDYIEGDETSWEREPMERLARDGQLMAYKHTSFWQCMDNLREKRILEELWASGRAPWKTWK